METLKAARKRITLMCKWTTPAEDLESEVEEWLNDMVSTMSYDEMHNVCESHRGADRFCNRHNGCSGPCYQGIQENIEGFPYKAYVGKCGDLFKVAID